MIVPGSWDISHNPARPGIQARVVRNGRRYTHVIDFIIDTASDRTIIGPSDQLALRLPTDAFAVEATPVSTALGEVNLKVIPDCSLEFYDVEKRSLLVNGISLNYIYEPIRPTWWRKSAAKLVGIPYPPKRNQKYSVLGRDVLLRFAIVASQIEDFLAITNERLNLIKQLQDQYPLFVDWQG